MKNHKELFFIALKGKPRDGHSICILTPDVMLWAEDTWLLDMRSTYSFWLKKSQQRGIELHQLLTQVLDEHMQGQHQISCAQNFWAALILLSCFVEKHFYGMIKSHSTLSKKIFQETPWSRFFDECDRVTGAINLSPSKELAYKRHKKKMQSFIKKMRIGCPFDIIHIPPESIRRRFGPVLAMIWEWHSSFFMPPQSIMQKDFFPWENFHEEREIKCTRIIESFSLSWEDLEPMLRDDLNALAHADFRLINHKIGKIIWRIELDNTDTLQVTVQLKHPYLLSSDAPDHLCFLSQAKIKFYKVFDKNSSGGGSFDTLNIVGWDLTLDELELVKYENRGLFDPFEKGLEKELLIDLENKLTVCLDQYQLEKSFHIEEDFCLKKTKVLTSLNSELWSTAAPVRPLFIFEEPIETSVDHFFSLSFLERVAVKWWKDQGKNLRQLNMDSNDGGTRDYYWALDWKKRAHWVYQNKMGKWFIHGQFD